MANSLQIGKNGEDIACDFLVKYGYTIMERNMRHHKAEIDIIARKGDEVIFIEVKNRKNARYGFPEQSVTEEQAERISEAATYYLERLPFRPQFIRFDIIAITHQPKLDIQHFKDAF